MSESPEIIIDKFKDKTVINFGVASSMEGFKGLGKSFQETSPQYQVICQNNITEPNNTVGTSQKEETADGLSVVGKSKEIEKKSRKHKSEACKARGKQPRKGKTKRNKQCEK